MNDALVRLEHVEKIFKAAKPEPRRGLRPELQLDTPVAVDVRRREDRLQQRLGLPDTMAMSVA